MNNKTDLNDLLVFAKVAETQGISSAARALNLPKSKVSRRMVALEESLGTRLFERSTRAMKLTELGLLYYQHCKRIEEEVRSATESINQRLDQPRGLLRISASVTLGQHLLSPHIGEFIASYPQVQLDLDLSNRRVDLISEGFDLAIRVGELKDSSLVSKKLGMRNAKLYASRAYLENSPALQRLEDLAQHQLLVMPELAKQSQWILQNAKGEQRALDVKAALNINDFTTLKRVAETGSGITLLPSYIVEDGLENSSLLQVLSDWQSPAFAFYALYPSHRGLTRKARAFVDFIAEKLAQPATTAACPSWPLE